jgi:hypothetical protein
MERNEMREKELFYVGTHRTTTPLKNEIGPKIRMEEYPLFRFWWS